MIYIQNKKLQSSDYKSMSNKTKQSAFSQNSEILRLLLTGMIVSRLDAIKEPICSAKLGTRISDIREVLFDYGVEIKKTIVKSSRGAVCNNYFLENRAIKRILKSEKI